eukprot:175239-Chlamydomonas_euryale.AAC.1
MHHPHILHISYASSTHPELQVNDRQPGSKARGLPKKQSKAELLKAAEAKAKAAAAADAGGGDVDGDAWRAAAARASGQRVLDDPKLLRKSLKKEAKLKEKRTKVWVRAELGVRPLDEQSRTPYLGFNFILIIQHNPTPNFPPTPQKHIDLAALPHPSLQAWAGCTLPPLISPPQKKILTSASTLQLQPHLCCRPRQSAPFPSCCPLPKNLCIDLAALATPFAAGLDGAHRGAEGGHGQAPGQAHREPAAAPRGQGREEGGAAREEAAGRLRLRQRRRQAAACGL